MLVGMKPDSYTKFVLTVIAVALVWLCVERAVLPPAVAAQNIQAVYLKGVVRANVARDFGAGVATVPVEMPPQ